MEFIIEGLKKEDLRKIHGGERCNSNCAGYTCSQYFSDCRAYCGAVACETFSCADYSF